MLSKFASSFSYCISIIVNYDNKSKENKVLLNLKFFNMYYCYIFFIDLTKLRESIRYFDAYEEHHSIMNSNRSQESSHI
ncbi:hypothetical protein RhiirA1_187736 [Rhizophagus irregularis]|uniref:Uncharacterized protein n=1 Tax=Rhizophagus irregularis TaxID=588596 RepID=A0A2I1ESI4_9GLOM|nr:hypothetical protein RhiirA1_187736 [Rhizophagus irregularis]PKY25089.1 hypothetical protein RhiirB3_240389 [Rhizophagus irregularis]